MSSSRRSKIERRVVHRVVFSELKKLGVKYTDMNMAKAIEIIAEAHGLAPPKRPKERFSFANRIINRNAVKAKYPVSDAEDPVVVKFPKRVRSRPDNAASLQHRKPTERERQISEFYASWEWKRLSYDMKLKRGRKCECCGAAAPHVRIITDHVKPLRHHWHLRLDPSNLQVLCNDCNMGKGSRDESDFREPVEMVLWEEDEIRSQLPHD